MANKQVIQLEWGERLGKKQTHHTNVLTSSCNWSGCLWNTMPPTYACPKDNQESRCQSLKRSIIQLNIYRNLSKVNQVIYTLDAISVPNIMVLAQAVLQIFCWQGSIGLQCISQKREIIQPNIYRILPKVNKVIYTLNTICVPNSMILAQAVLQLFCWQGSIGLQCISRKRGIIQSNFPRILWKVNQVICIMYPNSMPDVMILAQAVLQILCWQDCFTIQNAKVRKGRY